MYSKIYVYSLSYIIKCVCVYVSVYVQKYKIYKYNRCQFSEACDYMLS